MNFAEAQKPLYEDWFRNISERLNRFLAKYSVPLTVKPPQDLTLEEVNAFITAGGPPQIFDNEIESAVLMLVKTTDINNGLFVPNQSNLYSAVNATQGGKNGSCVLYIILKRLWCHLHGQDCEFLYVCPGDTTIEEMTRDTYIKIVGFIRMLEFQNSVNSGNYTTLMKHGHSDNAEGSSYKPHIWSMTNKRTLRSEIVARMDSLTAKGKILITIWDEAHIAENKESIADYIFGDEIRQRFARQNHQLIFVSATPYTYHWSKYVEPIYLKLGSTYTGFNFIHGREVDPDVPIVTPNIMFFDEFQEVGKVIPLYPKAAWSPKALRKIGEEYGIVWSDFGVKDCKNYFNVMMDRITGIFRHYLKSGVHGFCVRFINNDDHTLEINERLRAEFKDEKVCIIKYTQDKKYSELLREITHCVQSKLMFIIVVTAKGRCSNRFPNDVQVFMDFTWKYSTGASMIQGFPGRASSYGTPRTIILSGNNYDLLMAYVRSKGKINAVKLKPHLRAVCNKVWERKFLPLRADDARAEIMFKHASRVLGRVIKQQCADMKEFERSGGKRGRSRPRGQWVPFETIFPQIIMQALEAKYGCRLLKLNQVPVFYADIAQQKGRTSYMYNNLKPKYHGGPRVATNEVFIAFRKNDTNGLRSLATAAAVEGKQTNSIKQSEEKNRGIEPHISFNKDTGKITHIDLALYETLKVNVGANPEAQELSMFDDHFERKAGNV